MLFANSDKPFERLKGAQDPAAQLQHDEAIERRRLAQEAKNQARLAELVSTFT